MLVTPKDAVRMAKGTIGSNELSEIMGKSKNYISTAMAKRSLGAQVMVDILDALGYDTIVRNRTTRNEIAITPSNAEMLVPHTMTIQVNDETLYERISKLVEDGTLEEKLKELL